jgi:hypothetical protein
MFLSQVAIWATFHITHTCSVGPCQRTWHATRMCTCPHRCQYYVHTRTIDRGLMARAVDLAVPMVGANVLVEWKPLHWVTGGCCTHTLSSASQKSTCRDKGCSAYQVYLVACHFLWYAGNESQRCVLEYTAKGDFCVLGQHIWKRSNG